MKLNIYILIALITVIFTLKTFFWIFLRNGTFTDIGFRVAQVSLYVVGWWGWGIVLTPMQVVCSVLPWTTCCTKSSQHSGIVVTFPT
jgi:hypothetical protein